MSQPQFHPKACAEFEKSALFYDEKFPGLGLEFAAEIEAAVAFVFAHPEAGMPDSNGFRHIVVRRFPFSVIYLIQDSFIYIIGIAHQRRRPDYWSDRA